MKISSRVDYALSCVLRIADKFGSGKPVSVSYISDREEIETDYVEQLLIRMKRAGILKSIRGPLGGYLLSRSPSEITAKDVILAIEKDILEPVCSRRKARRKRCLYLNDCKLKLLWEGLGEAMSSYLGKSTLKKLLKLRRESKIWKKDRR